MINHFSDTIHDRDYVKMFDYGIKIFPLRIRDDDLLLSEERPLAPPNSERVAELPATPGVGASITRYVPHTYIGVFLRVFIDKPQLVLTTGTRKNKQNKRPRSTLRVILY